MFVIINVDDFGLHPAVGRAVSGLSKNNIVTSTSILANGPWAKDAVKLDGVGLGVHLNVLRGRPLLPLRDVSSLVGDDGLFVGRYPILFIRYITGGIDFSQVRNEWKTQIERLLDMGIKPTHLDSEKHIHAWPGFMEIAVDLAREYGISWVRRPMDKTGIKVDLGGLRTSVLNFFCMFHKRSQQVAWPDAVWGIANQGKSLSPSRYVSHMKALKNVRVLEIACHPGLPEPSDPPIPQEFGPLRVGGQWQVEYDSLLRPEWKNAFADTGAQLVNYGQINPLTMTVYG